MLARTSGKVAAALLLAIAISTPVHAEFTAKTGWSKQLFPSFLVATATIKLPAEAVEEYEDETVLGDKQGLLGVTLEAEEDDTPITVTITCDAIMEPSTFSGTLSTAGEVYTVLPKVKYKYDVLGKQHQPGPITVTYEVTTGEGDDEETEEISETLTLRSVNDCPYAVVEDEERIDTCFMFAAYVNEQHPFVDKILREALNLGVVDSFTGYQSKDKAEVYRQLYALWHALSKRDLRYSDITVSAADSDNVASQHVRMIDESINNSQANCVDGSVLLASLLRKIGIEPILVMVPGHCYLAFYLDAEGKEFAALETTMLGSVPEEATEIEGLGDLLSDNWQNENSWKTFTGAIAIGNQDITKNAKNFKSGEDADYQLIVIAAARKLGILPIAYQSGEDFVSSPRDVPPMTDVSEE